MEVPPTTTLLRETPLVRALHSAIRNKDSSRRTFVTSADRLVQASRLSVATLYREYV
jgi:hypothetical protein